MSAERFHLAAIGVPAGLAQAVAAGLGLPVRLLTSRADRSSAGEDEWSGELEPGRTIGVLAGASCGVRLARAVHAVAPDASVVFVSDPTATADSLRPELATAPGIGRATRCLADGTDRAELVTAAVEEFDHARTRHRHLATMDRVRGAFDAIGTATPANLVRYLGRLFDHAPIAIVITDADGRVEAANPVVEDVLGQTPVTAIGHDVATLLGGGAEIEVRALLRACLEGAGADATMVVRPGPDGTEQHLEVTVAPVDPEVGGLGAIVLMHDETGRIRALEQAERDRTRAHDAAQRYARLAATLQESLLPPSLPDIPGMELAAAFRPAGDGTEIGGDFYDVFETTDDSWCVVVGDVCGKGAGAARLTASTRYTLRAVAARSGRPDDDLAQVNRVLRQQYEADRERGEQRHATAVTARLRHRDDGIDVTLASGGHPPPLVLRSDGSVLETSCRGPLLGVFDEVEFRPADVRLEPGDVLVLFTDGLTEGRRRGEFFGDTALQALLTSLAGGGALDVCDRLLEESITFQGGTSRDDLAVVVVRAPTPPS